MNASKHQLTIIDITEDGEDCLLYLDGTLILAVDPYEGGEVEMVEEIAGRLQKPLGVEKVARQGYAPEYDDWSYDDVTHALFPDNPASGDMVKLSFEVEGVLFTQQVQCMPGVLPQTMLEHLQSGEWLTTTWHKAGVTPCIEDLSGTVMGIIVGQEVDSQERYQNFRMG